MIQSGVVQQNARGLSRRPVNLNVDGKPKSTNLLDHRKHPRFVVVIPVRSDTEIDLLSIGIRLETGGELEDAIEHACEPQAPFKPKEMV